MMKGDCNRYITEFKKGDYKNNFSDMAIEDYTEALNIAQSKLATIHPTRLKLALNLSVFYYEILNNKQKGSALAKQALDDANAEFENLSDDFRDSTLIMQLLKDKLTLWANDVEGSGDAVEEGSITAVEEDV